jgi:hypothetical protein
MDSMVWMRISAANATSNPIQIVIAINPNGGRHRKNRR